MNNGEKPDVMVDQITFWTTDNPVRLAPWMPTPRRHYPSQAVSCQVKIDHFHVTSRSSDHLSSIPTSALILLSQPKPKFGMEAMYNPHNGRLAWGRGRIAVMFAHYNHFGMKTDGSRNDHTGDTMMTFSDSSTCPLLPGSPRDFPGISPSSTPPPGSGAREGYHPPLNSCPYLSLPYTLDPNDIKLAWSWFASHSLTQRLLYDADKGRFVSWALGDAYPESVAIASFETGAETTKDELDNDSSTSLVGKIPGPASSCLIPSPI